MAVNTEATDIANVKITATKSPSSKVTRKNLNEKHKK
jgi:hypothetical protein